MTKLGDPVWLKISAISTLLRLLRLGVYWTERSRHGSNLRNDYDPPSPDRHGRWLAPTPPSTGHRLSPRGKPRPESPTWYPPALPDGHGTSPPCDVGPPSWSYTPQEVATIATPETLLRWYTRLIAQKFDGSQQRRPYGRPRIAEEVEQLIVRMAEENQTRGYRRIQGALANLRHHIDAITVRNILRRHHMDPAPQRRKAGMSWPQFLKIHWDVLAATDFFTVEVATWYGLVTYYVLVIMELSTRRAHLAGITPHPTDAFMMQCARQLTDPLDGFLLDKRYLIHDRDAKFLYGFDQMLQRERGGAGRLAATEPESQCLLRTICTIDQRRGPAADDRDRRGLASVL